MQLKFNEAMKEREHKWIKWLSQPERCDLTNLINVSQVNECFTTKLHNTGGYNDDTQTKNNMTSVTFHLEPRSRQHALAEFKSIHVYV